MVRRQLHKRVGVKPESKSKLGGVYLAIPTSLLGPDNPAYDATITYPCSQPTNVGVGTEETSPVVRWTTPEVTHTASAEMR